MILLSGTMSGQDIRSSGLQLNGTWLVTVGRPDITGTPTSFNTLMTFLASGAVLQSSGLSLRNRGTAHGHWISTGDREFLTTFYFMRFDPETNQFLGATRVTQRVRLNESMDEYKASSVNQALDLQGRPSASALIGTETARRLPLVYVPELPAPPQ
ncbi:MAG: hypothetical protein WKF37_00245 [Bryobacteraceae bacterium]